MASDLLDHQDEDQYFYASQYDQQRGGMNFSGAFMSDHPLQTHNDIANSLQNIHSADKAALNTNAQSFISTAHGGREPQSPHSQDILHQSFHQPVPTTAHGSSLKSLALPGLLNVIASPKSVSDQKAVNKSPINAVVANGVRGERVEQVGSDLEEGELSEGTHPDLPSARAPSTPRSAEQSSLKANGTVTVDSASNRASDSPYMAPYSNRSIPRATEAYRQHASGADCSVDRQSHQAESRKVHSMTSDDAKPNLARRTQASSIQRQRSESSKVAKAGARRAVKQLQPHNIGYLQLLRERIDAELLKKLFGELNVKIPDLTQIAALPTSMETQSTSSHTSPKRNLGSVPKESFAFSTTNKPVPSLTNRLPTQQRLTHNNKSVIKRVSHTVRDIQPNLDKTLTTRSDKLGQDRDPMTIDTGTNQGRATSHSLGMAASSPAVNGDEPASAQTTVQEQVKPPVITTTSKPSAPRVVSKPVDRKDYVARLLAAKAGKGAAAANATKPSAEPVSQNVGRDRVLDTCSQTSQVSDTDPVRKPGNNESNEIHRSSEVPASTAHQKIAAAEAKKRAQTELARRKIEELRQQSEARKKVSSAADAVTIVTSIKQPSPPGQSTQAPPVSVTQSLAASPIGQNTRRYSYFPLQNTTFALPGLFMSGQQLDPDQPSDAASAAPISGRSEQTSEPQHVAPELANTDGGLDQTVPRVEDSTPSVQEDKVIAEAPIVEATTSEADRRFHKRSTSVDFIDAVPAKSRRLNALGGDNSVVFDITDDEADESVRDASGMQLDGDHSGSPNHTRDLQISHPGNTGHAVFRQHPALSDPYAKLDPSRSTPTSVRASQTPTKHKESGGLRSNEEEIARMKRRIAEMEERRKSKQAASPAQMPAMLVQFNPSVKPAESPAMASSSPIRSRRLSQPASPLQRSGRTLEGAQTTEPTLRPGGPAEQRVEDIEQVHVAQPLAPTVDSSANDLLDQQKSTRRDIESAQSLMSAAAEKYMAKLQKMQKERAEMQAQLQKKIDDERAVQEEFDRLLQASMTDMNEPKDEDDETKSSHMAGRAGRVQDSDTGVSHQVQQEKQHLPAESLNEPLSDIAYGRPRNDDSTIKHTVAPEPSTPDSSMSVEVPTEKSLVGGEFAEDVMDISGSESEDHDEGEATATRYSPGHEKSAGRPAADSDSEEIYEPPQSFGPVEEKTMVSADSGQYHPEDSESLQRFSDGPEPETPPANISGTIKLQDGVADEASIVFPPGASERAPSPIDMSDSDDYEPPEPMSSVEDEPLINDAASPISQSSFPPPDAEQLVEVDITSPDQLSVKQEQIANDVVEAGLCTSQEMPRCLPDRGGHFTPYENDLILVQMGAVPEGLSAERKDAFVVGLRQIIQEIRGRKVKDFRTVASEIAAYRARFLGDNSKILPL
ncbi:MAG: hypothetical protein Q9184_000529 [Pyrenodesmia sp. 2 TL-2023]